MGKGIGLIGNFRGKVGNMVGYNLKDSNNKQTQGVRVYQPVVKNPKTYAQAEQRAKLAPINATYRALKTVIDRGQESKAYGNKSRLAWLKDALKAFNGGWFEKGSVITAPGLVPLTKGSLPLALNETVTSDSWKIDFNTEPAAAPTTVGTLAAALIANYPSLKAGDQLTFVAVASETNGMTAKVISIVLDTTDTTALDNSIITASKSVLEITPNVEMAAQCIILSRESENGGHLRSNAVLAATNAYPASTQGDAAKEAAIKSYMAAGATSDWPEEKIEG